MPSTIFQKIHKKRIQFQKKGTLFSKIVKWHMRRCGCTVPDDCLVIGRPNLRRHEGTLILGRRVLIGADSSLYRLGQSFPTTFSTGPNGIIEIGDDAGLNGCVIHAMSKVSIGKRVLIAGDVRIMDDDGHPVDVTPRRYADQSAYAPVVIEDDVWLCLGVTVLKGVTIGNGSVIATGSVVTHNIPSNVLAGGVPATVIRPLKDQRSLNQYVGADIRNAMVAH